MLRGAKPQQFSPWKEGGQSDSQRPCRTRATCNREMSLKMCMINVHCSTAGAAPALHRNRPFLDCCPTLDAIARLLTSGLSECRSTPVEPIFLNFSDLFPSFFWVGLTLAFDYRIDPERLHEALQQLFDIWPILDTRCRVPAG